MESVLMSRMAVVVVAALAMASVSLAATDRSGARERIQTGSDLVEACRIALSYTQPSTAERVFRSESVPRRRHPQARSCDSYLQGFLHNMQMMQRAHPFASPSNRIGPEGKCIYIPSGEQPLSELEYVVVNYGDRHAHALPLPALEFLTDAFAAWYPCPARPGD